MRASGDGRLIQAALDFILPLVLILLGVGAVLTTAAVILIVVGAHGARSPHPPEETVAPVSSPATPSTLLRIYPVALSARLDPELSRWRWLVKWFLAIPHFIVLAFLWMAFFVLTLVAAVAIIATGRYPRGIFDFNVCVMQWSWRVSFYATTGGIGTDRYPLFSLHPEPGDPAGLDVTYPATMS